MSSEVTKLHTVLAVDDDPQSLILLSNILTSEYEVLLAKNSKRGIEIAQATIPDLIILDIMMPDINGFQVLSVLKSNPATASIPVIFLTSRDSIEDERIGLLMGAADYITKPISPPVVLARIAAQLGCRDKFLHQPLSVSSASNAMRDGFISALTLQLAHNPSIRIDALLETIEIIRVRVRLELEPILLRNASCLALIGLNQPHGSLAEALSSSRLLIEDILNQADPDDPTINLAWSLSLADGLLGDRFPRIEAMDQGQFVQPTLLFNLALTYHVTLLQPSGSLSQRHQQAFKRMLMHHSSAFLGTLNQEELAAVLLASSHKFVGL